MANCPKCGKNVGKLADGVIARVCEACMDPILESVCRLMRVNNLDDLPEPPPDWLD